MRHNKIWAAGLSVAVGATLWTAGSLQAKPVVGTTLTAIVADTIKDTVVVPDTTLKPDSTAKPAEKPAQIALVSMVMDTILPPDTAKKPDTTSKPDTVSKPDTTKLEAKPEAK